jgi:hypothetical protein
MAGIVGRWTWTSDPPPSTLALSGSKCEYEVSMIGRRAVLLGGLASLGAVGPTDAAVPIAIANRRCIVPVLLDGRKARMVLDTGAERTVVTREAVKRLGLRLDLWVESTLRGAGGSLETHANADIGVATVAGVPLFQRQPGDGLSLAVTSADLADADGLLGADVLRHYALDLDFPRARLALRPAYQVAPAVETMRLRLLWPDLLLAPVRLDGHDLTALVDTGASASLVNARGLYRLDLTPERVGQDPAVSMMGLGGKFTAHLHRFAELGFGSLTVPEPLMLTAAIPEPAYDLTLGLDVLGQQRVLLSYVALTLGFSPV